MHYLSTYAPKHLNMCQLAAILMMQSQAVSANPNHNIERDSK